MLIDLSKGEYTALVNSSACFYPNIKREKADEYIRVYEVSVDAVTQIRRDHTWFI